MSDDPVRERDNQRPDEAQALEWDVADGAAEAKVASHLRMRALGIQDRHLLRAFELVPRALFVAPRHRDLSARDVALPIGCGQTTAEPGLIARMVEALAVERAHRVLEIGAGSGFVTAILAHLAASVLGLERFRGLAAAAQERLDARGCSNAAVVWADGLAATATADARFDRVIVHGVLDAMPPRLVARLDVGAVVVCARRTGTDQAIVRLTGRDLSDERPVCACRLQPLRPGLAAMLYARESDRDGSRLT